MVAKTKLVGTLRQRGFKPRNPVSSVDILAKGSVRLALVKKLPLSSLLRKIFVSKRKPGINDKVLSNLVNSEYGFRVFEHLAASDFGQRVMINVLLDKESGRKAFVKSFDSESGFRILDYLGRTETGRRTLLRAISGKNTDADLKVIISTLKENQTHVFPYFASRK